MWLPESQWNGLLIIHIITSSGIFILLLRTKKDDMMVFWAFVAVVLCHDGNPSQGGHTVLREILMGRIWMKRAYWRRWHLNGVRERIGMVVVLGLLSEIYTQLHTIDGLPGPQTYKSSISMGSYPQLFSSFFEHHCSILRPAKRNTKMQFQVKKLSTNFTIRVETLP